MNAAVELHDVIAVAGMKPLSARLRSGEVIRVDGSPRAVSALLDVIAGRRPARSGTLAVRGGARLLVRDGDRMAAGVDPGESIAVWSALAGEARPAGPVPPSPVSSEPATRGEHLRSAIWIVDGELADASEAIVQRAAEAVRAGDGVMVWSGGARRARVDRVLVIEDGDAPVRPSPTRRSERPRARPWPWRAVARFVAAAASARPALAVGVVVALWTAACAATVAAHEGFWYAEGSAGALRLVARLSGLGAIVLCATAAAARAATAPTWPAMLRETDAGVPLRALVLIAGDAGGAAVAAAVAAMPAIWARDPIDAGATWLAGIAAAAAAGTITRALRLW